MLALVLVPERAREWGPERELARGSELELARGSELELARELAPEQGLAKGRVKGLGPPSAQAWEPARGSGRA
ncbi:hypothetical protein AB4Z41_28560, partial [Cupriavidus sp. RAF12]